MVSDRIPQSQDLGAGLFKGKQQASPVKRLTLLRSSWWTPTLSCFYDPDLLSKWVGLSCSGLGLFTYGWSLLLIENGFGLCLLLTVGIWLGLSCIRWNIGLVFFTLPPRRKLDLVFFANGSPTARKKTNVSKKDLNCKQKRRILSK